MTASANEEELPQFREGAHRQPAPSVQPTMVPMTMMKPGMMMGPLDRDDSLSSTAGSTVSGWSEVPGSTSSSGERVQEVTGEEEERTCESPGNWLCRLQHLLCSRKEEEEILLRTYMQSQRRCAVSATKNGKECGGDLCLISGAAGLGKTRLARTLARPVLEANGYFLSAKFDQLKQARPIRIFADAFTEFTHSVLAKGPEVVEMTKRRICDALGDELGVLLSGIPVLEKIVGKSEGGHVQIMTCPMAKRFVFALQDLIGAVCTAKSPMVLFFDDLMWADPCSLKLLKSFIACNQNPYLFILATCDDTVGPSSPVSVMLRDLEDEAHRKIFNIEVTQKDCLAIKNILDELLPMPEEKFGALGKLVCGQTHGNPLYIIEFIRWLYDERLLEYDASSGTWILHDSEVHLSINVRCLGSFLVDKLENLPGDVQQLAKVAACFGNEVNEELLSAIFPSDVLSDMLHAATSRGVLIFDEETGYSFRHDGLQRASLNLITSDEKELLHLSMGRKLLKGLSERQCEKHMYNILGQMRLGKKLIKDTKEKHAVAMLCMAAGQASARESAFGAAAGYFKFGIEMIGKSWKVDYGLKLALHNATAEMNLTLGNYESVHKLLQVIFENVPNLKDKLQAYNTLIYCYGVQDKQHLAVDTGIKVLAELGVTFPRKYCKAMMLSEMRKVRRLLKNKSKAQLLRMPNITDEEKLAALQLLNIMFLNAALVRPKFAPFLQLKSVEITMRFGLSALASSAFASYGMLCIAVGKYDDAFRYGELSLDLLKMFRSKEYVPRVYAAVYGCIKPWQRPIRETIEHLKKAQEIGSQTGDIEFACLNANLYSGALFFSDAKLPEVSKLINDMINMMTSRRQDSMLVMLKPFQQLTLSLMESTKDPMTFGQDIEDVNDALKHAQETRNASSIICLRLQTMMLNYLLGNFEKAGEMVAEIEGMDFPPPGIESIFCKFFIGMTHLANARSFRGFRRIKCLSKAKQAIKEFKNWSLHSPHNCLPMKFLLEAEMASFRGKNKKAYEKYTAASALAKDAGFRMIEAMCHEHAGRHLCRAHNEPLGTPSLKKAASLYKEWGAAGKVKQLDSEINKKLMFRSLEFQL